MYQQWIEHLQPDIVLMSLTASREVKATEVWKKLQDWEELTFLQKKVKSYSIKYCVAELENGHKTLFFNLPPQQVAYGGLKVNELICLGKRIRDVCIEWGKQL